MKPARVEDSAKGIPADFTNLEPGTIHFSGGGHTWVKIASLGADKTDMDTIKLISAYLDHEVTLGKLHRQLQEGTWGRPLEDALALDVRRLIGEATSAEWGEEELREELSSLMSRLEAAGQMQDALRDVVAYLTKETYFVVAPSQASASAWSLEVRTDYPLSVNVAKVRDQAGAATLG